MKAIRIYTSYFSRFLQSRLAYRLDFFAALISSVVISVVGLLFVHFLIDGKTVTSLAGWSREEVLFLYGYSFLATAIFSVFAPNLYSFGDKYVIQGQFDRVLLRPLSTLPQVLFETFNLESLGNFAVAIVVIESTRSKLRLELTALDSAWLLASAVSGAVILLSVFVIVSSFSFFFEDRLGLSAPFFNLLTFTRYPLPIFDRRIQFLLSWIVPFGFVSFYPATHFFRREGFETLCYATPLVALAIGAIALVVWEAGVARYTSTGN